MYLSDAPVSHLSMNHISDRSRQEGHPSIALCSVGVVENRGIMSRDEAAIETRNSINDESDRRPVTSAQRLPCVFDVFGCRLWGNVADVLPRNTHLDLSSLPSLQTTWRTR